MKKLFKSRKFLVWSGLIVVVFMVLAIRFGGNKGPTYETIIAAKSDLIQEVSVTGKVKAAQSVDLQFQNSGRVASINYKAGDRVSSGVIIASLDNQDLQAVVLEKQAALTSAQADLDRTIRNLNSLNNSSISSSLKTALDNAKVNLDQVIIKADADLKSDYQAALNEIAQTTARIDSSSIIIKNIYTTNLQGKYAYDHIENLRLNAVDQLSKIRADYSFVDQPYVAVSNSLYDQIDSALSRLLAASQTMLSSVTSLQSSVQTNPDIVSSTDRTNINSEANSLSAQVSALSTAISSILDQRVTNNKNISDAKANLATAQAAFPTQEDVIQKQAALRQAEAALLSAQSQLRKSLIIAPFEGVIARIDIERGETVSSTTSAVSLISVSGYQIEANITEVDITKVKIGDSASLTLDAYGSDTVFKARVSSIDPGETIIEGVTTYKTTFDFEDVENSIIRPNMTANVDIETNRKEQTIAIPQRAVITRNGEKLVRIDTGGLIEERIVTLGITGKDGYVEVLSGISEGEKVITFINE